MFIPGIGFINNIDELINDVEKQIHYPVTKKEIIQAMYKVPDIPLKVIDLVDSRLPEGTYNNLEEIKHAAGL